MDSQVLNTLSFTITRKRDPRAGGMAVAWVNCAC
jgi:hypothetical protein